jgi:hypothetical protein
MTFEKPTQLISLLTALRDEPIKSNYENIYIQIAKEAMTIEFKHNSSAHFEGLVYKKLIQLSVKEYVYSGQTLESLENLNWLIGFLDDSFILVR